MADKKPVTPTYRFSFRYFKNTVVLIASLTWLLFLGGSLLYFFQMEITQILDHMWENDNFEEAFRAAKSEALKNHVDLLEDSLRIPDVPLMLHSETDGSMSEPEDASNRPGEKGQPVVLTNPTEAQQKLIEYNTQRYGYNKYISDFISVNRTLVNNRDER